MGRKDWFAAGLVAIAAALAAGLAAELAWRSRLGQWRAATGAVVASNVSALKKAPMAIAASLARQFSTWESLPGAALSRFLKLASRHNPALSNLMVVDLQGRILASFNPEAPPSRNTKTSGGLDAVEARRRAILKSGLAVEIEAVEAGAVTRLELGAPLHDESGELRAYVAATLSLTPLQARLKALETRADIRIVLADRKGNLVYPMKGGAELPRDARVLPGGWKVNVTCAWPVWHLAALPCLGVSFLAALLAIFYVRKNQPPRTSLIANANHGSGEIPSEPPLHSEGEAATEPATEHESDREDTTNASGPSPASTD